MQSDGRPQEPWEEYFRLRMRARREELGLSQSELARRVRERGPAFHQQTVARIEAGDRPIRLGEAYLIAVELQSRLDDLVTSPEAIHFQERLEAMTFLRDSVGFTVTDFAKAQEDLAAAADKVELSDAEREQVEQWLRTDPLRVARDAWIGAARFDDEHLDADSRKELRAGETPWRQLLRQQWDAAAGYRDGVYLNEEGGVPGGEHPEA